MTVLFSHAYHYIAQVSVMMECGSIDFAEEVLLTLTTQKNKEVNDLTNPWPVLFYEVASHLLYSVHIHYNYVHG